MAIYGHAYMVYRWPCRQIVKAQGATPLPKIVFGVLLRVVRGQVYDMALEMFLARCFCRWYYMLFKQVPGRVGGPQFDPKFGPRRVWKASKWGPGTSHWAKVTKDEPKMAPCCLQ